ncbi:MAG TPA: DUF3291 domain-containing protein [Acidobacteriota bacterium]|nr:DUF3291 domain-containing protein [Acidobacteriota bacterium]
MKYQLGQLNIALMKHPLDAPEMADFVNNLDRINTLAESAPGFIWRLQTDEGDATALRPFGDQTLVNMSVWKDLKSLRDYVYRSAHVEIMKRRKEWFQLMSRAYQVLWWVPQGHRPSIEEARIKLEHLRQHGPSQGAFTFSKAFPPPDAEGACSPLAFPDRCPAS